MLFAFRAPLFRLWRRMPLPSHQLLPILAVLLTIGPGFFDKALPAESVEFRPAIQRGGFRQAKAIIEVEGKLKLNADGQGIKHLPLKVHADLQYAERLLSATSQWSETRLLRAY